MSNATATFVRQVRHFHGTACVIEPGDTTTTRGHEVTCPGCRSQMPGSAHGCDHPRIFVTGRPFKAGVHPPTRSAGYSWACVCGYRTTRLLEDTPARWLTSEDNPERLARIDAQIEADR